MPWYPQATRKNIPPGPSDPRVTPTAAILHVAVSEADTLFGWFNGPSGGVESHFYVRRTGVVEQYRDTDYQADAQLGGAKNSVSIETQGLADGRWTPEQVEALARLLVWLHGVHPIPLAINTSESDARGIAWHAQYGSWHGYSGRTCPGVERIPQIRAEVLPRALALASTKSPSTNPAKESTAMSLTPADLAAITKIVDAAITKTVDGVMKTKQTADRVANGDALTLPETAAQTRAHVVAIRQLLTAKPDARAR